MNIIIDDYGIPVAAIGAPGSIERVKVEFPKLIDLLNRQYEQSKLTTSRGLPVALQLIREAGINSRLEIEAVLEASSYQGKF